MSWTVAEVMTREVVTVSPETPFKTCVDQMRIHEISALPVTVGETVVGIVTESDLMLKPAALLDRQDAPASEARDKAITTTAGDVMTRTVVTVARSCTIGEAARLMTEKRIGRLPVTESGRLIGIVSRSDILSVYLRSDESIRRDVAKALGPAAGVPSYGIGVEVNSGVVEITGSVPSALTALVLRLVWSIPGVVGVDNRLSIAEGVRATG